MTSNRHSWARAWHAKLRDSRDTSSNHHADNSSVCLLCLSPAWLMFVVFFLSLLFLSPQCRRIFLWDKPMVIYELRRFSALSIMTGQKDKLNGRALSYFHYSSWLSSSFFFFLSYLFHFALFLFPFSLRTMVVTAHYSVNLFFSFFLLLSQVKR